MVITDWVIGIIVRFSVRVWYKVDCKSVLLDLFWSESHCSNIAYK